MSTMTAPEIVIVLDETQEDDGPVHLVCHCTGDRIAACGLDVTDEPWMEDAPDEDDCPLCVLATPDDSCRWGCDCEECC